MADKDTTETTEMVTDSTETVDVTQDSTDEVDLTAELEETRKALKRANREAAERRKLLEQYEREAEQRKQDEMSEIEKLQAALEKERQQRQEAEAKRDLLAKRQQFYSVIAEANLQFANEQARRDAALLVDLSEMDDQVISDAVHDLKKARPYLFAQAQKPDIDGQKRGTAKGADEFEDQVRDASVRFGFDYVPLD